MTVVDYIKDALGLNFRKLVRDTEEEVTRAVNSKIRKVKRNLMRQILSGLFIFTSVVFLALAFVFAGIEYLNLSNTLSFLIMGVILLFIGFIIKLS